MPYSRKHKLSKLMNSFQNATLKGLDTGPFLVSIRACLLPLVTAEASMIAEFLSQKKQTCISQCARLGTVPKVPCLRYMFLTAQGTCLPKSNGRSGSSRFLRCTCYWMDFPATYGTSFVFYVQSFPPPSSSLPFFFFFSFLFPLILVLDANPTRPKSQLRREYGMHAA